MKTSKKLLAALIALILTIQVPITAFAFTTKSLFTSSTYTHQSRFEGEKIYEGIDVSKHNGVIDWKKVKAAGVDFAIIRVGYRGYGGSGSLNKDVKFDDNMQGAIDAGLQVGVYFYSQAITTAEAKAEAEYAIKYTKKYNFSLPIFYDYEFADVSTGRLDKAWKDGKLNKSKMTDNAIAFCDTVKKAGYDAMVYANKSFLTNCVSHKTITDAGYKIWLAHYNTSTGFDGDFTIWQYSSKGRISGCNDGNSGYVDSNFMYGDMWEKLFVISDMKDERYTGSEITPEVVVTYKGADLKKDVDYTLKYYNNTEVGQAKVKVTGIGKYSSEGDIYMTFDIRPPAMKNYCVVSTTDSTATVSWSKNKQVDYCKVQVYKDSAWKTVARWMGSTYTIKNLRPCTGYKVRLLGVKNVDGIDYTTGYTPVFYAKTKAAKVTGLKAATTVSSVKYTWDKQINATGYKVYKYNYSTKKYSLYKTVTGGKNNSCTISGLKPNSKVRIKVRAYRTRTTGTDIGPYSDGLTAYAKPGTPELTKVYSPGTKKAKLTWTSQPKVSGYQVKRSTVKDFSRDTETNTITSGSTATITTGKSGKRYYFKVRSYKYVNGKKYYSGWSNVKSVVVK
ncbi:MAG: GH25 family lysozyme [Eubacterium sp.]